MKECEAKDEYQSFINSKIMKFGERCAEVMGIPFEEMIKKTRKRQIVTRRQIAMTLAVEVIKDASLAKIGLVLGGKDHATVLHANKTILLLITSNKDVKNLYFSTRNALDLKFNEFTVKDKSFIPIADVPWFLKVRPEFGNIMEGSVQFFLMQKAEQLEYQILFFAFDGIIIKTKQHEKN